ncbi:MAG: hypothetical protein JST51_04280 [Armatimonadetes bacterium]|nr:hypothetical protein [Armatimonadota bacterium]
MALPDVCPRCGERATNEQGKCVFCGTQVTDPRSILSSGQKAKALAIYQFASWSFLVLGLIYLAVGIVSWAEYHLPMLGMLITAVVALVQGGLLIVKNEWMQSVTKMVCIARLIIYFLVVPNLIPFLLLYLVPGIVALTISSYDILCLFMMMKAIDDVHLA